MSIKEKDLYFKQQRSELAKMSHENAERTHPTGIEGHVTRKLAKNTRENCESSL
jgi:hypothetical protein